jgi:REP element-mobilizing transposase RayT
MARRPRLDEPGALHHLTARGIERRSLFVDDYDRRSFVRSMERIFLECGTRCLAWALMTNHVHLLVESGAVPISTVMQRLLTRHAVRFNRRHDRVGHLFQNRFHSVRIESERHLLTCVRYIHLNPVAAGIVPGVESLAAYPWTGHAALMGRRENAFQDVENVLSLADPRPSHARETMREFVRQGIDGVDGPRDVDPPMTFSGRARFEARTFGLRALRARWRYVDAVRRRLDSRDAARSALRRDGWSVDRVLDFVCRRVGAKRRDVEAGRRTPEACRARAVVAFVACERLGETQSAAARRLGVTQQSMRGCMERGRRAGVRLVGDVKFASSDESASTGARSRGELVVKLGTSPGSDGGATSDRPAASSARRSRGRAFRRGRRAAAAPRG